MTLEFRILGPLEAVRDGRQVRVGGRKLRSLLALLLLRAGEFCSADLLIDELWHRYDDGALARLQVHVSQLRKALGPDAGLLETRPGGYALVPPPGAIDAARFEALAREGRDALAAGDPARAAGALGKALGLWRGPALGDLAYEPFAEGAATRLDELRLVAREDRVDAELALGRHRELVAELEVLTFEHPLRERLRSQLMLALYRCGRQADSLAVFEEARQELADEGLDPSPALAALQLSILRQDPALLVAEPEPAPVRVLPTPSVSGRVRFEGIPALVERESVLETLADYLEEARGGQGRFVFLGGEAGVGKTVVLEAFAQANAGSTRVLTGACDGTSTPRPLGAVFDMVPALRDGWGEAGDVPREGLFAEVLEELGGGGGTTVAVFEDVHWADEATLDLIRYLARRVRGHRALVVASFRDDEVGRDHPLTVVLGDAATLSSTRRITLPRLTAEGVGALSADSGFDPNELYRRTGGNSFFVTEVLAAVAPRPEPSQDAVPTSIRDAVLARASRLSPPAREALSVASVVGQRAEPWLLERLLDGHAEPIDECLEAGMLRGEGAVIAFRHELARLAIEENVPAVRRVALHRRILAALVDEIGEEDAARLAHHAEAGGDRDAVLAYAPLAAERASRLGAHREAAAQYGRALRFARRLAEPERADLLERFSIECYMTHRLSDAIEAREAALAIRRAERNERRVSEGHRWLSRLAQMSARRAEAERHAQEAVRAVEGLSPGPELAFAYSNLAQLRTLSGAHEEALDWGTRAADLAERLGAAEIMCHALGSMGTALLFYTERVDEGRAMLERSLELARLEHLDDHGARAYTNLVGNLTRLRRYQEAEGYFGPGLEYCSDRDVVWAEIFIEGLQALFRLERGRWDEAAAGANPLLRRPGTGPLLRITPLMVIGLIRVRRGTADPWDLLDEALSHAERSGEVQWISPVTAARAEAAWLQGDPARETALLARTLELALERGNSWMVGELAFWLSAAGEPVAPPERAAEPFKLQIEGRWADAAGRWGTIGCPYERAMALAHLDDETPLLEALGVLDGLGAAAAAGWTARRMRSLGLRAPRRPRGSPRLGRGRTER